MLRDKQKDVGIGGGCLFTTHLIFTHSLASGEAEGLTRDDTIFSRLQLLKEGEARWQGKEMEGSRVEKKNHKVYLYFSC